MDPEFTAYMQQMLAPLMVQQKIHVISNAARNLATVADLATKIGDVELAATCMARVKSLVAMVKDAPTSEPTP